MNDRKKGALVLLQQDALRIQQVIENQKNNLCLAHCKAFEEIIDTQMYGFSKEVNFAVRLGALEESEGKKIIAELEGRLNQLYTQAYEHSELKEE
ncbi:DUF1507 family protein [Enterococcus timonensis]|uniref:DUF1507 family protein n=1 Tax=Enterococcus timonensis TaxID=1852364 RepID=UPI0008DA480C|nr:DUF1507 family protein [Enterococcus timonensis]